jgi:hypothetical protein
MSDPKQDATGKLPPDAPTQTTPKGLKIGIPTRGELADALRKISRPAKKP